MRMRNSPGSESKVSSSVDEIFALHPSPLTQTAHPHRVASAILFLIVTFIVGDVSFIFLIVLILVWLFPKKDIASRPAIRTVCLEALRAYSAHVHMVLCARWQAQRVLVAGTGAWNGDARIAKKDQSRFRLTHSHFILDDCDAWTNASLTRSSSYWKCSKRRILGHSAQATSLRRIEGTTRCSLLALGSASGSTSAFAAEVNPKAGFGFRPRAASPVLKTSDSFGYWRG
jgi:hypothetical protein